MIKLLIVAVTTFFFSKCEKMHIINIEADFNKVKSDNELAKYVSEILNRLKTFKVPVHPRIRLFYQLLKKGIGEYADRTSDTIFVPFKYNMMRSKDSKDTVPKDSKVSKEHEESEESKESKEAKDSKESKGSKESKV